MNKTFSEAIRGHEDIFQDCDDMFFMISWLDIPTYCEIMKQFCENDLDRECIREASRLYAFLDKFGETISETMYFKIENDIEDLLSPIDVIADRYLSEMRLAENY